MVPPLRGTVGGSSCPAPRAACAASIPLFQSRDIAAGSMTLGQTGIILFQSSVLNPLKTSPHPSLPQLCWGLQPPCLTTLPGQGLLSSFSRQNVPGAAWPWHLNTPQGACWNGCCWRLLGLAFPRVTPSATPPPSWSPDPKQNPVKSQPGAGKGERCSKHTEPHMS